MLPPHFSLLIRESSCASCAFALKTFGGADTELASAISAVVALLSLA
jgi:hypothetical protein